MKKTWYTMLLSGAAVAAALLASSCSRKGMGDSPVAVLVSAKDGSEYDAGLATQMMAVEAVLLDYGTKIISSPTIVLNGEDRESYKQLLGIPDGMSVKGVLLVGSCDSAAADAVSGATPRKDTKEVVTFVGK